MEDPYGRMFLPPSAPDTGGADIAAPVHRIEGELSIYSAKEIQAKMISWLPESYLPIELDLSGITEIDGAGIQLLLLLHREAMDFGRPLKLVRLSDAVKEALTLCDLNGLFGHF